MDGWVKEGQSSEWPGELGLGKPRMEWEKGGGGRVVVESTIPDTKKTDS
jgi:hypothetical protein